MDRTRRALVATRRIGVVLAILTLAGCSSGHQAAVVSSRLSLPATAPQPITGPTPTQAATLIPGATTQPIPAGVTTLVVTFLLSSDSFSTPPAAILWQRTIQQQSLITQVVALVDALQTTTATRGCTESNVMLRLDFTSPSEHATFDENSPCAKATLVIGGSAGPALASNLISQVEQLVGVQATTGPDGHASVTTIG